jgi:hypothetical protein
MQFIFLHAMRRLIFNSSEQYRARKRYQQVARAQIIIFTTMCAGVFDLLGSIRFFLLCHAKAIYIC